MNLADLAPGRPSLSTAVLLVILRMHTMPVAYAALLYTIASLPVGRPVRAAAAQYCWQQP